MNKRTHNTLLLLGLILSSNLLLSACGQKGPLYMPEKKSAPPATSAAANSADTNAVNNPQK